MKEERLKERFSLLEGRRVKTADGQEWEYSCCNEVGVPYFKKVIGELTTTALYVLPEYRRDWAEETLGGLNDYYGS